MASNQLGNVYSGGAVVFHPQSSVQYYGQMLQHRQAKDEALGRYYQDLGKNINGAGMRTQDIESGWNQKVNDWQKFYSENADKIKYPTRYGAAAQNEFYSRYRDIMNDVDRSKEAGKNEGMVRQKMLDPKWREQTTDQDLAIAGNMSKSIYDPQHYKDGHTTPYSPLDFSFNAPKFDVGKQKAALDFVTHGLARGNTPHPTERPLVDKEARTVTTPMVAAYDKPTYDAIVEKGAQIYKGGDPSAQRFFENELHNQADLEQLNAPFKKYFGRDIGSPEDVARAWVIQNVPQSITGKSNVRGYTDPWESVKKQEAYYDYREGKKDEKSSQDEATVENFMQGIENEGKKAPPTQYITSDGKKFNTYEVKLTPALKRIFTVRVGAHLSEPDVVRVNAETGDYLPIHYEKKDGIPVKGDNGNISISKTIPTQAVSREAVKASLATILPKRAVKQLQGSGAAATPKDKTPEEKADELLKKYSGQ